MRTTNTVMFRKCWADFLSIALKETTVGPRSSGTPVLVNIIIIINISLEKLRCFLLSSKVIIFPTADNFHLHPLGASPASGMETGQQSYTQQLREFW